MILISTSLYIVLSMFSFIPYHSLIVTNLLSSSCYPAAAVVIISMSSANFIDVNNFSTPLHFCVSQFASVNVVVFISKCCSLQEVTLVFFHDIIVDVHNYLHNTMLPCLNIWENRNKCDTNLCHTHKFLTTHPPAHLSKIDFVFHFHIFSILQA